MKKHPFTSTTAGIVMAPSIVGSTSDRRVPTKVIFAENADMIFRDQYMKGKLHDIVL
jgi:hypothetical protein